MLITAVAFTGTARMRDHWSACTSCFMCPQRKKCRHVRSGDLVYETVVETEEDLVARITVDTGNIADMPGIFE